MSFSVTYKRTVLFVIALAIIPLLFGNAFHYLFPGSHVSDGGATSCCAHDEENDHDSLPTPEESCLVCDFLAMPCDVVPVVTGNCILDLVERRESEPVQVSVVLYRPFEPGRAPPTLS